MRILVVSTCIFPVSAENKYAGIETLVRLISNELNGRGHKVSLVAPEGSQLPSSIEHIDTGPGGDFVESERKALHHYESRLPEFDAVLDFSHSHWCMMERDLLAIAFIWHDPYIMKPQEPDYNVCALSQWQALRFRQVYGYEARVLDPICARLGVPATIKTPFLQRILGDPGPTIDRFHWVRARVRLTDRILEVGAAENQMWRGTPFNVTKLNPPHDGFARDPEYTDVIAYGENLPFEDNEFEVVSLCDTLEHVKDPTKCVQEATRVAKRKLLITVPYEYEWSPERKPFTNPDHVRYFTPARLEALLKKQKFPFRISDLRYCGWAFLVAEIEKEAKPPLKNRFVFIGRMAKDKGCLETIKLCRMLGVPLDIVGTLGPNDPADYLEKVVAFCDAEQIVYLGAIGDSAKIGLLKNARALLYPVSYPAGQGEAHSHKMVDALMAGCPCVSYNRGAMNEVIEHGVTGFLADNEGEFIHYMLETDTLDSGLIEAKAKEKWSVEATTDRIVTVMEAVARGERWGRTGRKPSVTNRPQAPSAAGYLSYTLPEHPRQVRLDTINSCNAKCIPCHLLCQTTPRGGRMDWKTLVSILDDIKDWGKPLEEIVPVNFGEMFLLGDWYEILKLMEEKLPRSRIALPTNGSFLDDDTVRRLASVKTLKWVNFSINAFFKETYEAFTGLGAETIGKIRGAAETLRLLRPDIVTCASMIFDTSCQTELERDQFIRLWKPLVSVVSINPAAYCNSPLRKPLIPVMTACRSIFDGLTVLHDGKVVTGCCFDATGALEVGDASSQSLIEIWRGSELKRLCHLHNEGRRREIELCSQCGFA